MSTENPTIATVVPELPIIHLQDPEGGEIQFKIKFTTPFRKVFDAYCERKGVNINQLRFLFDGRRIRDDQTMQQLEMQNGDVIDVVLQQTGGAF